MKNEMMKINVGIISDLKYAETLAKVLESEGHNVYVFKEGNRNYIDETSRTIYVHLVGKKEEFKYYKSLNFTNSFIRKIAQLNLSVIHLELGNKLSYFAFKLSKVLNIKVCSFMLKKFLENVDDKNLKLFAKNSSEISVETEELKTKLQSRNIEQFINVTKRGFYFKSLEYTDSDVRDIIVKLVEKYKIRHFGKGILIFIDLLSEDELRKLPHICYSAIEDIPKSKVVFYLVTNKESNAKIIRENSSNKINEKLCLIKNEEENIFDFCYLADIYLDFSTDEIAGEYLRQVQATKTLCLTRNNEVISSDYDGIIYSDPLELFSVLPRVCSYTSTKRKTYIKNALKTLEEYSLDKYYKRVMIVYNRALRKGF